MAHSTISYIGLKTFVTTIRILAPSVGALHPDEKFTYKSRDKTREVAVHVYRSSSVKKPSPVLINWHGSGFVLPHHGTDEEFCKRIVAETAYTVLDAAYALAPEHPFPAALHDVEDLILDVLGKPDEYDTRNIVLSGFSAGGNLALAAATDAASTIPAGAVRSLMGFYPVIDLSIPPAEKHAPDGSVGLPPMIAALFNNSYMPPGSDPTDPRISPALADPVNFPDHILFITAEADNLAPEVENLAGRLEAAGKQVVQKRMAGVKHGFDKNARDGSDEAERKKETYDLAVKFLNDVLR